MIRGLSPELAEELKAVLEEWAATLQETEVPEGPITRERNWYNYYFSAVTTKLP